MAAVNTTVFRDEVGAPASEEASATTAALLVKEEAKQLANIQDLEEFLQKTLNFDPFRGFASIADGGAQLDQLLKLAEHRLEEKIDPVCLASGSPVAAAQAREAKAAEAAAGEAAPAEDDGWGFDIDDLTLGLDAGEDAENAEEDAVAATTTTGIATEARRSGSPLEETEHIKWSGYLDRVQLQRKRLEQFIEFNVNESKKRTEESPQIFPALEPLQWNSFRETCESSLFPVVDLLCDQPQHSSTLEAFLRLSPRLCEVHWQQILEVLPVWVAASAVTFLLPVPPLGKADSMVVAPDASSWYIGYALCLLEVGLFVRALEFLLHGIYACIGERWPRVKRSNKLEWLLSVRILPKCPEALPQGVPLTEVRKLFGLYRLIVDYWMASQAIREEQLIQGAHASESAEAVVTPTLEVMPFREFCCLKPAERAYYSLLQTPIDQVKKRLKEWATATSLEFCRLGPSAKGAGTSDFDAQLSQACDLKSEELLMEALVHLVGRRNQDPQHFALVAEAVEASVPTLPTPERLILSPCVLLKFILDAVYNSDIRYRATDIFHSVDKMYQCIPQPDALVSLDPAEAQHWQALHREADRLEKHLSCTEVFLTRNIRTSMRFADMRACQTNPVLSSFFTSNILSNLAGRYVNAGTWREQLGELFYVHSHALTAEPLSDFVGRLVRILTDSGHYDLIPQATEALVDATSQQLVADFLIQLAKEKVNNALPKKGDKSLAAAQKVLRHVPDGPLKQREQNFIVALELLGDLLWVQGPRGPLASLRREKLSRAPDPADRGFLSTFDIRGLAESNPIALVAALVSFNPEAVHSEDFHRLCASLGLHMEGSSWPQVAAQMSVGWALTGFCEKAQTLLMPHLDASVTQEEGRRLSVCLGKIAAESLTGGSSHTAYSDCSKLLVSPMRASPTEHLPVLLHTFDAAGSLRPVVAPGFEAASGIAGASSSSISRFPKFQGFDATAVEGEDESSDQAGDWEAVTAARPLFGRFTFSTNYCKVNVDAGAGARAGEGEIGVGTMHSIVEDTKEEEEHVMADSTLDGWDQFYGVDNDDKGLGVDGNDKDTDIDNDNNRPKIGEDAPAESGREAGMSPAPSHVSFSFEDGDKGLDGWDQFYEVELETQFVGNTMDCVESYQIQDDEPDVSIERRGIDIDFFPCKAAFRDLCASLQSCGSVEIAASLLTQGSADGSDLQCPTSDEDWDSNTEALCEKLVRLTGQAVAVLEDG